MSLQEWERDVINRQRNIVFPDTMLNASRFYRNIASGKVVFSRWQKISLLLIVSFFIVVNVVDLVIARSSYLSGWELWPLIAFFIGCFLDLS